MTNPTNSILALIAASNARANAATEWPWITDDVFADHNCGSVNPYVWGKDGILIAKTWHDDTDKQVANRDFIASARTEVPRLNEALKVLVEAINASNEADRLYQHALDHQNESEGCGYSNDPTGSLHVTESFRKAERAREQADALMAAALSRALAILKGGGGL